LCADVKVIDLHEAGKDTTLGEAIREVALVGRPSLITTRTPISSKESRALAVVNDYPRRQ
jgi:hypothetical protein